MDSKLIQGGDLKSLTEVSAAWKQKPEPARLFRRYWVPDLPRGALHAFTVYDLIDTFKQQAKH